MQQNERNTALYEAILRLNSLDECIRFFDDLCAVTELRTMEQRYAVAGCLLQGKVYSEIRRETGASSATVSRVNRMLNYGTGSVAESVKYDLEQKSQEDAIIHRIIVKDRKGNPVDVVLGYDTAADYELNTDSMGAAVGRFANRIAGAQFPLYEEIVHITPNQNGNCLHSGLHGFNHTMFDVALTPGETDSVTMTATSPAGTDGFPGNFELTIQYSLAKSGLVIRYGATTDAPTVCNMTNHSYFNLNGHASGSALGHRVTVDADFYLEADAASIPTGRKLPVKGTPMDFTEEKTLGLDIGADFTPLTDCCGYDQCYVIRDSGLRHAAWAVGPETGIRMEVLTTLPGVHLYTANFLAPVTAGKDGAHYAARDAVCFETEDFPDAPNHPNFPDTTLLPGKPYSSTTIYRFDLAEM